MFWVCSHTNPSDDLFAPTCMTYKGISAHQIAGFTIYLYISVSIMQENTVSWEVKTVQCWIQLNETLNKTLRGEWTSVEYASTSACIVISKTARLLFKETDSETERIALLHAAVCNGRTLTTSLRTAITTTYDSNCPPLTPTSLRNVDLIVGVIALKKKNKKNLMAKSMKSLFFSFTLNSMK